MAGWDGVSTGKEIEKEQKRRDISDDDDEEDVEHRRGRGALFDRKSIVVGGTLMAAVVVAVLSSATPFSFGTGLGAIVGGAVVAGALTEFVTVDTDGAFGDGAIAVTAGCMFAAMVLFGATLFRSNLPAWMGQALSGVAYPAFGLFLGAPVLGLPGGIGGILGARIRDGLQVEDDPEY